MNNQSRVHLLSYASGRYLDAQDYLVHTARQAGCFHRIHSFRPKHISRDFIKANKSIFDQPRGQGYWLWKPYFINQVMETAKDGDIVFYCDSGAYFIKSPEPLFGILKVETKGVMSFALEHPEVAYTKRTTLRHLGADTPELRNLPQRLASFALFHCNDFSRTFVKDWLSLCRNEVLLTDIPDQDPHPEFVDHRHDQSIFSLLCKTRGIQAFNDPSQFGNHSQKQNEPYGQLINHTRAHNSPLSPALKARFDRFLRRQKARIGRFIQ